MNTPRGVVYHYMGPDLWTFFFLRLPSPGACGVAKFDVTKFDDTKRRDEARKNTMFSLIDARKGKGDGGDSEVCIF